MIAAYYNISYITMQTFLESLARGRKLKDILEIVTAATEFESIQIRRHEAGLLRQIYHNVPVKMKEPDYESCHFKAFILLQAHFSRMNLPIDLAKDQEVIVSKIMSLLSAIVDILSSEGHLAATNAMDMSQMVVQAMWDRDSPLKQIPHFTPEVIKVAQSHGIDSVWDFVDKMNPDENPDAGALVRELGLSQAQLVEAANFTNNKYPDVSMEFEVEDAENIRAGEPAYIRIAIERELDEDDGDYDGTVHAPFYPARKTENWWLVVAEERSRSLLAIKRVTIPKKLSVRLEFVVPSAGKHDMKLLLISDSYFGVDQDPKFSVTAGEAIDEDEDDGD
jgi:pre-mRNA-splicing helicase BRR2